MAVTYHSCVQKLLAADEYLKELAQDWLPHDTKATNKAIHTLESIQDAEASICRLKDNGLKRQLLEEVMLYRSIYYDIVDVLK